MIFRTIERRIPQSNSLFVLIEAGVEKERMSFGDSSGRNALLFVLKGGMTLENEASGLSEEILGGHFFFLPGGEGWCGSFLQGSVSVLFFFERTEFLHSWPLEASLASFMPAGVTGFPVALPFFSSVSLLLELLSVYMSTGADDPNLYQAKDMELIALIIRSYPAEKIAALFYPLCASGFIFPEH